MHYAEPPKRKWFINIIIPLGIVYIYHFVVRKKLKLCNLQSLSSIRMVAIFSPSLIVITPELRLLRLTKKLSLLSKTVSSSIVISVQTVVPLGLKAGGTNLVLTEM